MTTVRKKNTRKSYPSFNLKLGPREKKHDFVFNLDKKNTDRFLYFKRMMDKVKNVKGDIVECGIGESRSFQMLCLLTQNKKIIGFDSFEGFPEPTPEDRSPRNPKKGEWNVMEPEEVFETLKLIGLDKKFIDSRVKMVKGFFEKTLPKNKINKIALLHLDVDLYQSYKTCLKYLFPKVASGGIVLFDEYINKLDVIKYPGAKKAINEYFKNKKHKIVREPIYGKYYLIKKSPRLRYK